MEKKFMLQNLSKSLAVALLLSSVSLHGARPTQNPADSVAGSPTNVYTNTTNVPKTSSTKRKPAARRTALKTGSKRPVRTHRLPKRTLKKKAATKTTTTKSGTAPVTTTQGIKKPAAKKPTTFKGQATVKTRAKSTPTSKVTTTTTQTTK